MSKKSLEEEFQTSQIYKTLRKSGSHVADHIAQGLDTAAESVDRALNEAIPAIRRGAQTNYIKNQSRQTTWIPPQRGEVRRPQQAQQQPQPTRQAQPPVQPPQPPQSQQPPQQQQQPVPQQPVPQQPPKPMKMIRKRGPARYYITAAIALQYALTRPMTNVPQFILFGIVTTLVFVLTSAIFRGKKTYVPLEEEETPAKTGKTRKKEKEKSAEPVEKTEPEKAVSQTGNPEVDKLIEEGNRSLKKLREANDAIPEETLTEDITRMENAAADIFRFIADHPEKAPQIRKFMNYYLPTTLKLLDSYRRLSAQSAKGENITSTMFNIAGMMHTVADAFEKQLDSLFTDEAMDVSADISVFETLLKSEGFVDDKAKPEGKTSNGSL